MTQKFEELHISVTPIGDDEYLVRTEQAPKGVLPAEEQVTWPVGDWLRQARQLMDDPLLGLLRSSGVDFVMEESWEGGWNSPEKNASHREVGLHGGGVAAAQDLRTDKSAKHSYRGGEETSNARTLVALGQQLYSALFQGSILDRLSRSQAIAHNQDSVLRLRLGLKDALLPRLPWEVLHEDSRPIATGKDVVFSRYQPTLAPMSVPEHPGGSLKILMVLAAPTDQENLALKKEAYQLSQQLSQPSPNGESVSMELEILEQPDRESLTLALEQNQYQVFHYAGHSDLGATGGELYLVNNKTGLTETLSGDDLAGLLVNNGIRLALFNSCRSSYSATSDLSDPAGGRNLAEVLVKRGIPGVLAMAERIPDEVALNLTRLFYKNLKQGYPVDLSLNRARQGLISTYGSDQLYWALPVLYLHQEFDGYLSDGESTTNLPRLDIHPQTETRRRGTGENLVGFPEHRQVSRQHREAISSSPLPSLNSLGESDTWEEQDMESDFDDDFYGDEGDDRLFDSPLDEDSDSDALVKDIFSTLKPRRGDFSPTSAPREEFDDGEDDAEDVIADIFQTLRPYPNSPTSAPRDEFDDGEPIGPGSLDDAEDVIADIFQTLRPSPNSAKSKSDLVKATPSNSSPLTPNLLGVVRLSC
ncbi:CHAT domain-containing protein [[Phormidium] sp. ETS-05]|uniref:CHAT domain-containing protein n=1 Tax=[Phormidium] sp. ETS-05 TaxID=222819 RepID=UPI0031FEB32F